jgi:CheY-like chemotaxis protein/HPt (histidine-containing phosphotransfer) domain-containing protein
LCVFFSQVQDTMEVLARRKGVRYISRVSPDVPLSLKGDAARLRQVLLNLCGNATKFTHAGEVSVTAELVEWHDGMAWVRFQVRDTGIGIPEQKHTLIFESFTQADGSTTREYGGTGLGLAICKHFVELMGGSISLVSVEGQGSTFSFTLGLAVAMEQENAAPEKKDDVTVCPMASLQATPGRILLVEDYPSTRQVSLRHLHRAGYVVDVAENGLQAVRAVQQKHYDLILMDIQMPIMDGFEATKRIRSQESEVRSQESEEGDRTSAEGHQTSDPQVSGPSPQPSQHSSIPASQHPRIPIIAVTAHAMAGYREKCLAAGMDDYLTKPMRRVELLAMVSKWIGMPVVGTVGDVAESAPSGSGPGDEPMDYQRAVDEFEGDVELLDEVVRGFLENLRRQISVMEEALAVGDAQILAEQAHAVKGGAASLLAEDLARAARELEVMGRSGELADGGPALERLREAYCRLLAYTERRMK